jgi:hypothetical protein
MLRSPYFQLITTIILTVLSYAAAYLGIPLEPVILASVTVIFALLILWEIDSFRSEFSRELRSIRGVLIEIRDRLGNPSSYVWVKPRCVHAQVVRVQAPCKIWVRCELNLMAWHGCPEPCSGYSEPRPTGGPTLLGMIIGGLLGLPAGPLGVIFGGVAGGTIATAAENIAITPRLETEVRSCRARGVEPEIVIVEG